MASKWTMIAVAGVIVAVAAVTLATVDRGRARDETATITSLKPDLTAAPAPLKRVFADANRRLPGGARAFRTRLAELRGLPVVANKWASWCGPCRAEIPHFQQAAKHFGGRVAFLGVNSRDSAADALDLMRELPMPYPSYVDDRLEIAAILEAVQYFPATSYFSPAGRVVHTKLGEYRTRADLFADIERHALGGRRGTG